MLYSSTMHSKQPEGVPPELLLQNSDLPGNVRAFDVGTGFLWVAFDASLTLAIGLAFQPRTERSGRAVD